MTQIQWTKCSERMPPNDIGDCICKSKYGSWVQDAPSFKRDLSKYGWYGLTYWTPYTPEAWEELNR